VMNQGSVVQEGSAQDLYHRPVSQFVAQFIGRANLVPGQVTRRAGAMARVAALGGTIEVNAGALPLAAGDAVRLVLRPESIQVGREGNADGALHATVDSHMFLGEKIEYVLRCGGASLQIVRYNAGPGDVLADGSEVFLHVSGAAVSVLPGSDT